MTTVKMWLHIRQMIGYRARRANEGLEGDTGQVMGGLWEEGKLTTTAMQGPAFFNSRCPRKKLFAQKLYALFL